jgi:hypothetical protein
VSGKKAKSIASGVWRVKKREKEILMRLLKKSLVAIQITLLPFNVFAKQQPPLEQLHKQLLNLQSSYETDSKVLQSLLREIRMLEQKIQLLHTRAKSRGRKKVVKDHSRRKVKVAHQNKKQMPFAVARVEHTQHIQPILLIKNKGVLPLISVEKIPAVSLSQPPVTGQVKFAAEHLQPPASDPQSSTVRTPPTSQSRQAIYQEQHSLFKDRFSFETGLTYSHYDRKQLTLNGFLALDAIFLGNIKVDDIKADVLTLDLTGRYNASDRLQFDLNVPVLYRSSTFQSGDQNSSDIREMSVTMHPRVGDVNAGVFYQLLKETQQRPDLVWSGRIKAPTGSSPYGIPMVTVINSNNNLTVPLELPSGNGVWTLSTGLSAVKTLDPAIVFANVSYFHNLDKKVGNLDGAAIPDPGSVRLGDAVQFGVGTAFALNDRMSLSLSYLQRIAKKSGIKINGGNWTDVVGSDANAATLNIGATYAISDKKSIVVNVGAGLTPDAPNATLATKYVTNF